MLKQPVNLVSLMLAVGLGSNFQQSLGAELTWLINFADSLVTQDLQPSHHSVTEPIPQPSYNSVTEPIRLEISRSHHQVTVYQGKTSLKSYPVAVGRSGWETPVGNFQVIQMMKNPTWINPLTDKSISGGSPQNPLGRYWIGFWTNGRNWVGFHGTPDPTSVGQAASHGCIRMYSKDVEELFYQVHIGTPVTVVR